MESSQDNRRQSNNIFNVTLATVVGQVGCLTPVILLGFLFLGITLDRMLGTNPTFTVIFILVSIPVSVVALIFIVRHATNRLKNNYPKTGKIYEEETNRD